MLKRRKSSVSGSIVLGAKTGGGKRKGGFSKVMSGGSSAQTKAREDYKGLDGENWEFELNTIRRSFQVKRAKGAPECNRIELNMKLLIFL